jgi:hypothetical protein
MDKPKPDMRNYPYVERCYNYIVYDEMSFEEVAEAFLDDFVFGDEPISELDIKNTSQQIKEDFERYINDGGTLVNAAYLTLR